MDSFGKYLCGIIIFLVGEFLGSNTNNRSIHTLSTTMIMFKSVYINLVCFNTCIISLDIFLMETLKTLSTLMITYHAIMLTFDSETQSRFNNIAHYCTYDHIKSSLVASNSKRI